MLKVEPTLLCEQCNGEIKEDDKAIFIFEGTYDGVVGDYRFEPALKTDKKEWHLHGPCLDAWINNYWELR